MLASGGFSQALALRKHLFPHAPSGREHRTAVSPGNTGDGWRLAESAGGQTAADLANAAAWIPVSLVPRASAEPGVFPHLIDRYKPGVIAVTRAGTPVRQRSQFLSRLRGGIAAHLPRRHRGLCVPHLRPPHLAPVRPTGSSSHFRCRCFPTCAPAICCAAARSLISPNWLASTPRRCSARSIRSMRMRGAASTLNSARAPPPTIDFSAMPTTNRTPASRRSSKRRSTR